VRRCGRWTRGSAAVVALLLAAALARAGAEGGTEAAQLQEVRSRIESLEAQLAELQRERTGASAERERLSAEVELAEARVREVELVLQRSRDEVVRLRDQAAHLGRELEGRRRALALHLEMMAVLGRPGPLQLLFDAARGGNLEQAFGTVSVLTAGQVRLMQEYGDLQRERAQRMAELSQIMATAEREAGDLVARRQELSALRDRAAAHVTQLERQEQRAVDSLEDMREREQALGRLMQLLGSRERSEAAEDVRRFRGAMAWPAPGRVIVGFGRHYLPKYATYTVCNGIRLDVPASTSVGAVFPGVVAYAQHFKGYGNMVVVDHGHRVFSLVSGLATIFVRVNQRVAMGLALGLTPPPTEDGNLYLEIRVDERPEDPRRWLQLKEGRS
jgi:murein hydrolase activator